MSADFITAPHLQARHGFFTRRGGLSQGPYASLNCSLSGGDDPAIVAQNRGRVAAAMGIPLPNLLGVTQIHGPDVITVETPWPAGQGPKADALVTRRPGLALGIITADCAPVLFADPAAGIVGAAHAGWRGAVAGILDATIAAMTRLGAKTIQAAIGPCIAQQSYEVSAEMRDAVLTSLPNAPQFFTDGVRPDHWQFDLPGYCLARLAAAGVAATWIGADTLSDPDRFYSHRRRTLAAGGPIGHQISIICS